MMKSKKVKIVTLCLLCLMLCGCSKQSTYQPNSPQLESEFSNSSSNKLILETYSAQIEYYSDLVTQLQEQIVEEKERNYIEECEYKLMIKDLEAQIQTLNKKIETIQTENEVSKPNISPTPQEKPNFQTPSLSETVQKPVFKYSVVNGEIHITEYIGTETEISIPEYIDGFPVTVIGDSAFKGCRIVSISLPNNVKTIDWFAFSDCIYLQKIDIPPSVTSVGYGAFDHCPKTLTIVCQKGSYIESYAASWGIVFKNQ